MGHYANPDVSILIAKLVAAEIATAHRIRPAQTSVLNPGIISNLHQRSQYETNCLLKTKLPLLTLQRLSPSCVFTCCPAMSATATRPSNLRQNDGPKMAAATLTCTSVALVVLSLRLFARIKVVCSFGWDVRDSLVALSLHSPAFRKKKKAVLRSRGGRRKYDS